MVASPYGVPVLDASQETRGSPDEGHRRKVPPQGAQEWTPDGKKNDLD